MKTHFSYNLHFIFLLVVIIFSAQCFGQMDDIKFSRFSIEDGLSQTTVNCMLQDNKGFIWIGTQDGLNRYDGYQFKIYHNEPGNLNSLSNNFIEVIFQDNDGNLWIGTRNGLNKFNLTTNTITRFEHNEKDSTSLSESRITTINQDKDETLWVGTTNGLNRYNASTNSFDRIYNDTLNASSISHNFIRKIYFDHENTMWVGTREGLNRFDEKLNGFIVFKHNKDSTQNISNSSIKELLQDKNGSLWIGTDDGLNEFNYKTEKFTNYKHNPENENSLSDNIVQSIIEDKSGFLWVGTFNGLNRFDKRTGTFVTYKNSLTNPRSISENNINCLIQDYSDMIWIGTQGGAFNKFYPDQKKFNHFKTPIEFIGDLSGNILWAFQEDQLGNLWYGTLNGVYVYDPTHKRFRSFQKHGKNLESGLLGNNVYTLVVDRSNNLWIGSSDGLSRLSSTYMNEIWNKNLPVKFLHFSEEKDNPNSYSGTGVSTIYEDKKTNVIWIGTLTEGLHKVEKIAESDDLKNFVFTTYDHDVNDSKSISHNWINYILRDENSNLWIATEKGLDVMNETAGTFKHYTFDPTNDNTISEKSVSSILLGNNNILWIGTFGGGLNKFNTKEETFVHYTMKDGLANNNVYGVLSDSQGHLWMSTNIGISKFDLSTETFRNYNFNDGLQSDEFNAGAFYKSKSGKLFFGGINGFNSFYPDSIKDNTLQPTVFLTELMVLNKLVETGATNSELEISKDDEILLTKDIAETDTIYLSYKQNIFSIEFSALHFQDPKKNQYAYQLVGFDNDWVYTSADNRRVTYTNLKPKTYTFNVKASNSDGLWNEEAKSIVIIIAPPFWQTWWFYLLSAISLMTIIFIIFRVKLNQVRLKSEKSKFEEVAMLLQLQNDEKTALMKETHHRVKNNLQVINSLLRLQSNQIEDEEVLSLFEEAENRVMTMALLHEKMYKSEDLVNINIEEYITLLSTDLVATYALNDNIKLDLKIDKVEIGARTLVPLGLMINELITNSLKYAFDKTEDGNIIIHLKHVKGDVHELVIGDDGVGMSQEKFETATTLGLDLIRTFTGQLNGTIERLDKPGTLFKIVFERIDD